MEISTSMIEIDKTVLYSSVGLLAGWLLSEFKQMLAHRREDRKVIGIVLADLLEIRHNLFTMKTVTEQFIEKFKIPSAQAIVLKGIIINLLPHLSEAEVLKKRYSDAVTRVASAEPFLAFQLRGQNFLQSYLDLLQSVTTADEKALPFVKQIEANILKEALPNLERLMRALARSHSIRTRIYVWRHLRKAPSISKEMDKYLKDVEEMLDATMAQAAPRQEAAPMSNTRLN